MIDIENTLFYADNDRFFRSVHYLMKDDGTFFLADCRSAGYFEDFEKDILKYFDIEIKEDITKRV